MNAISSPLSFRFEYSFLLLALCLVPASASAQDLDNVTISGRVADQRGASIAGASVTAALSKTGVSRTSVTDAEGTFKIAQLEPGIYSFRTAATGFAAQEKHDLSTVAGQNLQLNVTLYPQDVLVDPVVVTSVAALPVDITRVNVGGTLVRREIEILPLLPRSPLDLILTLGGVTEEPLSTRDLAEDRDRSGAPTPEEAGSFALSGGPAYSNNLTIDGLDNNDDRAARERFQPPLEAVEEVQVITNQFSAEYGRASGGRVNLRTRGGTKDFHGRALYSFRDESLNANTFRNNMLGLKRLPLQDHNAGFTLGGPLLLPHYRLRNRTFTFISYEVGKVLDAALIDTLVPVEQSSAFALPAPSDISARRLEDARAPAAIAEIAPFISSIRTPQTKHALLTRMDHIFSETHNGVFVYQMGRLTNLRQFGGGNRLVQSLQAGTRSSDAVSFGDTLVFSQNTVNQARIQFSRLAPAVAARGVVGPVVLITINDPLPANDPTRRSGTLIAGPSSAGATNRREDRIQAQEVVFHTRGLHSLKFGLDVQYIRSTFRDLTDASGTFNFASAGDFLASVPSRFRQNFLSESTQRNRYLGLFLQDEWQLLPNLTIAVGLRHEHESIIRDRNNFGPRFSVAYDPLKSGKTVVRLGAGVFYNRALLRTIDDFTLGARQLFFDTNSLRDPHTGKLLSAEGRRAFIAANIRFPQTLNLHSPLVEEFAVRETGFSRWLDPALRIPESYQANFGVERDLGRGFIFETNYTLNRGLHLWREFNANAPVLPAGFRNFSEFLASRDFANFRSGSSGARPLFNATNAGELIRFVFQPGDSENPNTVGRVTEFGVPVSLVNLNSFTSSTALEIALAAINELRPDPTRVEVEQLISSGNSFYQGVTIELRRRFAPDGAASFSFRAAYTLSRLIDDGVVNTSDALIPGNFRRERARSLLDRRHRFVFSGVFDLPPYLGSFRLAPTMRVASGAPFNISIGGADRNLDDVGNDRPNFSGDIGRLRWRNSDEPIDPAILNLLTLPTIGQSGNLPRNAGRGPGLFLFDLSLTREFRLNERLRLRPVIEFDNVLNKTVFSFGAEFINFTGLAPTAAPEQRQAVLDSFLVPTRTLRPRQVRLGVSLDF